MEDPFIRKINVMNVVKGATTLEIVIVTGFLVEEGVPARDQDHDRARTHVPARDPVVIVRARVHHGAADPGARVPVPEINIVTRNASLFPKIEPSQNLDRALGREAGKRWRYDLKSTRFRRTLPLI